MNFKGYAVIEPTEPNSSKVFIKIKRAGAEAAMEDILNAFTEVLEENYTKSTTDESLIEKNKDVDQSVDTAIYGSDEYNKTKNMYAKQRSAWSGVYALIIGMLMCFAGLSGQFVLRGTNSSEALVGVSLLVIIYGIYRLIRGAM